MTDGKPRKKRLTTMQKQEREARSAQGGRVKERLTEINSRANTLRSKDKEFHGLERELTNYHKKLLNDYEISKDIKHPRDVGTVREVLLRDFFLETKLIPKRYAVSQTSVRVASTSGHISNELDILFYNALDSFTLMQRQNIYEVLPVEYSYGAIQVKSKLTPKEIKSAFENISSYKKLKRLQSSRIEWQGSSSNKQDDGFGVIFAYDTEMDWMDIVEELESVSASYNKSELPNAIFILSKGYFLFGDEGFASAYNSHIKEFKKIKIYGHPDYQDHCLYQLYNVIFSLLIETQNQSALPHHYARLPLTAGEYSYKYLLGGLAEVARCEEHGDYARMYTPEKLEKVINWCRNAEPINWVKAIDMAYENSTDRTEAYERQPQEVRIYNPKELPLSDILLIESEILHDGEIRKIKSLGFDSIESCGINMYIPYYYQVLEELVSGCAKCKSKAKAKARVAKAPK
ncbi:DUF6602 domain-containing protein [Pseudomonas nitroreducens]|uniref:DUF6602 domain-containing protein n=1 Tax=Pseudomonas nitroreducens TaxID=46680 RepID=UPI0002EE4105|nr:DUF6602 domain-containing protein [Pseudomonas nitroreducens]